jgi:hypothetical protein
MTYDLALQLVGEKLAGPSASTSQMNALWESVFPAVAVLISTSPRRLPVALSNAAYQLAATCGARNEKWRARLIDLAPGCTTADEFLVVAQLLAWRSGLAHFRMSALAAASALPSEMVLAILEAPAGSDVSDECQAHMKNPWFGHGEDHNANRRMGAFLGYGGQFMTPPLVTRSGSQILVRSGDESWILTADAFGATLHRATAAEISAAIPFSNAPMRSIRLPEGHRATSSIFVNQSCAITSAESHSIWLGPTSSLG